MTREEAYNRIDAIIARHEIDYDYVTITSMLDYDALRMARKALEQEPFMNKPRVANQICHEDKVKVLDKIKSYIDHIRNTGMGKKKSLEFIEKFVDGLNAESEGEGMTCEDCILDGTGACSRGAGRAVDDEPCEDFLTESKEND